MRTCAAQAHDTVNKLALQYVLASWYNLALVASLQNSGKIVG